MTDYNKYLEGLMTNCQRSVQLFYNQLQSPHRPPSSTSPPSSKGPRTMVPPPSSSKDRSLTAAAPTCITPRNEISVAMARSNVNKSLPPAANAPRSTTSTSASPTQKTIEPTGPVSHAPPTPGTGKDHVQTETEEDLSLRYRNLTQHKMSKELKRRGLLCGGRSADLAKRLEKDDEFQVEARTAEDYDTMSSQDIHSLCGRRSIPSNGSDLELRDRLKAFDKRKHGTEAAEPRLRPLLLPGGPASALKNKDSGKLLVEQPPVPTVKNESNLVIETAETLEQTAETTTRAEPQRCVTLEPRPGMQSLNTQHIPEVPDKRTACDRCIQRKRRCIHGRIGDKQTAESTTRAEFKRDVTLEAKAGLQSPVTQPIPEVSDKRTACDRCIQRKVCDIPRCFHVRNGDEETAKTAQPALAALSPLPALPALPVKRVMFEPAVVKSTAGTLLDTSQDMRTISSQRLRTIACDICRKNKRRCIHDMYGDIDSAKADALPIPRPTARKAYIKENSGHMIKNPELAVKVRELAVDKSAGTPRVTRSHMSTAKTPASPIESKQPVQTGDLEEGVKRKDSLPAPYNESKSLAQTGHTEQDVKRKENLSASRTESKRLTQTGRKEVEMRTKDHLPKSRRTQLRFQPKDDITLLQISVKLKEVIGWGDIHGFWTMVRENLQLKTGKEFKKVSRHVRMLVRKRRAERVDIEQQGKLAKSRVSAGCRPLLDKWIAGGDPVSSNHSSTSTSDEEQDDISLSEEEGQQLDSDETALEARRKRSATDAWLDTSCDTMRCKKLKSSTPELLSDTRKSPADCWSLSGSSVTSESSVEEESEEEDVKIGFQPSTRVKNADNLSLATGKSALLSKPANEFESNQTFNYSSLFQE